MFENPNKLQKRCIAYMDKLAKRDGFSYSLVPTHNNKTLLCLLYDMTIKDRVTEEEKRNLKKLCEELAYASRVPAMQGVQHPEPESMEEYNRLFNSAELLLDMSDRYYTPPKPNYVQLSYSIVADNKEVVKLQPGVQLKLFETVSG